MGRAYSDIAFTPTVREVQSSMGSRAQYAFLDQMENRQDSLGRREIAFVEEMDHFFQATVSETGWPYVQHRGGPKGFLRVLDARTLAFADFKGNLQYLSVGNLKKDDRISMILIDYAEQVRLKIIGHARTVEAAEDPELMEKLHTPGYDARIDRAFIITVEGYDWNCPQHITPRFTQAEVATLSAPLHTQVKRLKEQLAKATAAIESAKASTEASANVAATAASAAGARLAPGAHQLGQGQLALTISGIRQLTPRVRAYELRSTSGSPLPPVQPGAHIDVPITLPDGVSVTRRYSIASNPQLPNSYEIAVLREDDGAGGSRSVHDEYSLGMELHSAMPGNDFILDDTMAPALLIAGGIGITPIKSMAHALLAQGRNFILHYAVRSRNEAPFLDELEIELGERLIVHAANEGARMNLEQVIAHAGRDTIIYTCGPLRLIDAVQTAARNAGIAGERVRFERFTSNAKRSDDQPVIVTLRRSGKVVDVPAGTSILDAVQAAGVDAAASCRIGNCGACAVNVLEGTADHRDDALTPKERQQGRMCICVSRANSPALTLDL